MRRVKDLADVQIVLNEILDWKERLETKANDMHGLQIKNLGRGKDASDAVTVEQLEDKLALLRTQIRDNIL